MCVYIDFVGANIGIFKHIYELHHSYAVYFI